MNITWKRCRRREINAEEAAAILQDFLKMPLQLVPAASLVTSALILALETERTVYDSLYRALAIDQKGTLVTGNERFVNALSGGPYARYIRWIGQPRWRPSRKKSRQVCSSGWPRMVKTPHRRIGKHRHNRSQDYGTMETKGAKRLA